MSKWRPKDWKNPYPLYGLDLSPDTGERTAFEQGADAVIDALRAQGIDVLETDFSASMWLYPPHGSGKLVFIPD